MAIRVGNKKKVSQNLRSTIASFAVEDIAPSKQALRYCRKRDAGEVSCKQEVELLKKKYKEMASK